MLFNSVEYLLFLPVVFIIYWFFLNKNLRLQNLFLLLCGYIFYGSWDWRFVGLMMFSSVMDYTFGLAVENSDSERKRKMILTASVVINLGILGFFKYFNFFIDNFRQLLGLMHLHADLFTLRVILPVGVSFYTFQSMSYIIDVYRREIKAEKNIIDYMAFVSFFPLLLAGPIERANRLLPQFKQHRSFDFASAKIALRQILWGLFKKIVIADTCAKSADYIFGHYSELKGSLLVLGAVFFAVQIYCDFSGYSDIAIGSARLLGFSVMTNFRTPYFSTSIPEFWKRWHISLSSWFRDYLYIPLGGNRGNRLFWFRNIMIVFLLSGLWHGANWTFIVWGGLNGLLHFPLVMGWIKRRSNSGLDLKALPAILLTFAATCFCWIFFRAKSVSQAFDYIAHMFSKSLFARPTDPNFSLTTFLTLFFLIAFLLIVEAFNTKEEFQLGLKKSPAPVRWTIYYAMILCIVYFGGESVSFIYFQF